ncbi:MAG: hypothetical protein K9N23_23380, partial [Akkermansiaceae bacterium]|nr:hypothetical protein [Akkermansiaceae bacterium]
MHPKAQVVVGYFVDKDVVIEGLAVFRPSGRLLRIDADAIDAAGSRDWYFSTLPRPGVADYAAAARARPGSSPYQELLEEITAMEARVEEIKARKKQTQHPIDWAQLDEADRFERPVLGRKRLLDAVHMIAYRAETALCSLLRSATIDNAA